MGATQRGAGAGQEQESTSAASAELLFMRIKSFTRT